MVVRPCRGEGMVVSCYADTSPAGVRPLWREHLKNEVKRIDETLSGNAAAIHAFHRNIAAIEAVLSSRRRWRSWHGDLCGIRAQPSPGIRPRVSRAEPARHRRGAVSGSASRAAPPTATISGRAHRHASGAGSTPRSRRGTHDRGDRGACSEAAPRGGRAVGQAAGHDRAPSRGPHPPLPQRARRRDRAAWPEERYDGIVLLGEHEVLEKLRTYLPGALRSRIAGEAPHAWVGRQTPLCRRSSRSMRRRCASRSGSSSKTSSAGCWKIITSRRPAGRHRRD
jgi:hypothetical protein